MWFYLLPNLLPNHIFMYTGTVTERGLTEALLSALRGYAAVTLTHTNPKSKTPAKGVLPAAIAVPLRSIVRYDALRQHCNHKAISLI